MLRKLMLSVVLSMCAGGVIGAPESVIAGAQKKPVQKTRVPKKAVRYSCPMDPEVVSTKPGTCPKCRMALRPVPSETATVPAAVNTPASDPAIPPPASNNAAGTGNTGGADSAPRIPDVAVLDQEGRKLNFYTDLVKGKTVAINFVFTTCTTICPPLTATFRRVQQDLGERVGRDVRLISVSVDPATDTPERLAAFSAKFKVAPGWTFVTGSKPEIDTLLRALGVAVGDKNDHTPMMLIINDETKKWTRTYGLARPSQISGLITETANAK